MDLPTTKTVGRGLNSTGSWQGSIAGLRAKPGGNKRLERPSRRWEDYIKMDG